MDTTILQKRRQERLLQVKKDTSSCSKTFKKAYEGRSRICKGGQERTISALFRGPNAVEIELKRVKRLEDVSLYAPRYLNTFKRAFSGKSLRACVNAFCVECNGFDAAAVRDCTAPACPLFSCRPGYRKGASA
jgi:hypothetical protein